MIITGATSSTRQQQRTLWVSVAATFVVLVTYTMPLATLTHTARTLSTGVSGQAWILSAMSLGLAAVLLASGAVADALGRRKLFVWGAVVVMLASVVAALASSTLMLVLARVLQGIGGAALTSCSLGLLAHAFPEPAQRARATGLWGASIGAGIAVGPLLAALLDSLSGWRASYWLIAALAGGIAVAAARLLAESRSPQPRPVDVLGTTLLALGLASGLAGLVEVRSGWTRPETLALLVGGGLLLLAFVVSQARRRDAMLDLGLFRRADFVAATVGALANGLGIIALMSFTASFIERGLGRDTLTGAGLLLSWSGVSVVSALLARKLPPTITPRRQMLFALLGVAVAQVSLGGLALDSSLLRLLPGLLLAGVASGFLNAALARQAVASVPPGSAAMGSGANNTARYVGAAIGVTVVVLLAGRAEPAAMLAGWNTAVLVTAGFSLLGALVVGLCRWPSPEAAARA